MSMAMFPEEAPGLPTVPGGGPPGVGGPAPPMDALNEGPVPAEGGLDALMAAMGGGGMPPEGMPPEALPPEAAGAEEPTDPVGHIQQAMKHLLMAMSMEEDEERGLGITKGMTALQTILGGEQKKQTQLGALGG